MSVRGVLLSDLFLCAKDETEKIDISLIIGVKGNWMAWKQSKDCNSEGMTLLLARAWLRDRNIGVYEEPTCTDSRDAPNTFKLILFVLWTFCYVTELKTILSWTIIELVDHKWDYGSGAPQENRKYSSEVLYALS